MEIKQIIIDQSIVDKKKKPNYADDIVKFVLYKYTFLHTDLIDTQTRKVVKEKRYCSICEREITALFSHFSVFHDSNPIIYPILRSIKLLRVKKTELYKKLSFNRNILYSMQIHSRLWKNTPSFIPHTRFSRADVDNAKSEIEKYSAKIIHYNTKINEKLDKFVRMEQIINYDIVRVKGGYKSIEVDLNKYRLYVLGFGWTAEVLVNSINEARDLMLCTTRTGLLCRIETNKLTLYDTLEDFEKKIKEVSDKYLGTPKERVL